MGIWATRRVVLNTPPAHPRESWGTPPHPRQRGLAPLHSPDSRGSLWAGELGAKLRCEMSNDLGREDERALDVLRGLGGAAGDSVLRGAGGPAGAGVPAGDGRRALAGRVRQHRCAVPPGGCGRASGGGVRGAHGPPRVRGGGGGRAAGGCGGTGRGAGGFADETDGCACGDAGG